MDTAAEPPIAPRTHRQLKLWFYLGVPLVVAFFLGWSQVGRSSDWPKGMSLLYWYGVTFGSLFLLESLTTPFAALLRPRRVPLWLTLAVAQVVIGWIAILPVMRFYTEWVQSFLPAALAGPLQSGSLTALFQKLPTNMVFWVGLNLLFFHVFGMERFGYRPTDRSAEAANAVDSPQQSPPDEATVPGGSAAPRGVDTVTPAFFARLKPAGRGALLALQSDGHYLHVHTDRGSDMIHYRLGDAINELSSQEGMRVHRSWWVAERAIGDGGSDYLRLRNGLRVPVSRSYRMQARERGWLKGGAVSPTRR